EALRPSYLQGVATSLGGGTHFWLAGTLPPAQSRLRTTSQDRRNHGLSGHDSAHAQTSWLTKNDFSNRLSGTGGGTVVFSFSSGTGYYSGARFDLYDPTGNKLFTGTPGAGPSTNLAAGTYTLLVYD